jgi:hypothetical protein
MLTPRPPVNFHQYGCNSSVEGRLRTRSEEEEDAIAPFWSECLFLQFPDAFHVTVSIVEEIVASRLALS